MTDELLRHSERWRGRGQRPRWEVRAATAEGPAADGLSRGRRCDGEQVDSAAVERAIADLMALVRVTGEAIDNDEYQVRAGIDWTGGQPFTILTLDNMDSMMYRSPCTASRESKRP